MGCGERPCWRSLNNGMSSLGGIKITGCVNEISSWGGSQTLEQQWVSVESKTQEFHSGFSCGEHWTGRCIREVLERRWYLRHQRYCKAWRERGESSRLPPLAPGTNCTGGMEQGLLSPRRVGVGRYSLSAFKCSGFWCWVDMMNMGWNDQSSLLMLSSVTRRRWEFILTQGVFFNYLRNLTI